MSPVDAVGLEDRSAALAGRSVKKETKAALLDMDLAISFYLEAGQREKKQTLEELSASFQRSIGKVADEVLSAAASLESVADVLSATAGDTEERASTAAGCHRSRSGEPLASNCGSARPP